MQRFSLLPLALLISVSIAIAKQAPSASSQGGSSQGGKSASTAEDQQNQSVSQTGSSNSQQEQSNRNGGSPSSSTPGRVTGETPTQVQQALDKQLPAGSKVTASVADDGNIKLTGIVKTDADKAKAEQVARGIEGVKSVKNELRVSASGANTNRSANAK